MAYVIESADTCRNYNSREGCPFGNSCKFIHKTYSRACKFFYHSEGGCQFGADCFYSHRKANCDSSCGMVHNVIPSLNSQPNSENGAEPAEQDDASDQVERGACGEPAATQAFSKMKIEEKPIPSFKPTNVARPAKKMKSVVTVAGSVDKDKIPSADECCSLLQRKTDCITCGTCGSGITLEMWSPRQALEKHYKQHVTSPQHLSFFCSPEAVKQLPLRTCDTLCLACGITRQSISTLLHHVETEAKDCPKHQELMKYLLAPFVERDLGMIEKQWELYAWIRVLYLKHAAYDRSIDWQGSYCRERSDFVQHFRELFAPSNENGNDDYEF